MPNPNPFLASFAGVPSLVSPHLSEQVNACLMALASSEDVMAGHNMSGADDFWSASPRLRPYVVTEGILQIPIQGVLLNNFPYQYGSFATGYEYIARALDRGLSDGEVKGIALVVNSPGGMVAGNFDLADKIYAARGDKPIRAFVNEDAYSAAYSLASSAEKITVARTGGVGSIGVVTSHMDMSQMMDKIGVKVTFIFAGKHKVDGNAYEPLAKDTKARIQTEINDLYDIFVATVARNRGMDEKAVRDTEALTYTAPQALSIGLADEIGSFDDSLMAFAIDLNNQQGETTMSKDKDTGAVDQATLDAARAEARAEGKKEGHAEGVAAERSRIASIMKLDEAANRREAAFNIAVSSDMSVEQTKSLLATLPESKVEAKASGAMFDAAMTASGNPELGQDAPAQAETPVNQIVAALKAAKGLK